MLHWNHGNHTSSKSRDVTVPLVGDIITVMSAHVTSSRGHMRGWSHVLHVCVCVTGWCNVFFIQMFCPWCNTWSHHVIAWASKRTCCYIRIPISTLWQYLIKRFFFCSHLHFVINNQQLIISLTMVLLDLYFEHILTQTLYCNRIHSNIHLFDSEITLN